MAGEFADERLPDKFAKVEKEFKPQYLNKRLKPPKGTTASRLRGLKNQLKRG